MIQIELLLKTGVMKDCVSNLVVEPQWSWLLLCSPFVSSVLLPVVLSPPFYLVIVSFCLPSYCVFCFVFFCFLWSTFLLCLPFCLCYCFILACPFIVSFIHLTTNCFLFSVFRSSYSFLCSYFFSLCFLCLTLWSSYCILCSVFLLFLQFDLTAFVLVPPFCLLTLFFLLALHLHFPQILLFVFVNFFSCVCDLSVFLMCQCDVSVFVIFVLVFCSHCVRLYDLSVFWMCLSVIFLHVCVLFLSLWCFFVMFLPVSVVFVPIFAMSLLVSVMILPILFWCFCLSVWYFSPSWWSRLWWGASQPFKISLGGYVLWFVWPHILAIVKHAHYGIYMFLCTFVLPCDTGALLFFVLSFVGICDASFHRISCLLT